MLSRSAAAWTAAAAVALAGCGAAASGAATTTRSPLQQETAACSKVLTPWTQYIADSNDFAGWVETVGAKSPIVQLPQNAARIYLGEQARLGVRVASTDGFSELDRACTTFAASDPTFTFHNVPPAPSISSGT